MDEAMDEICIPDMPAPEVPSALGLVDWNGRKVATGFSDPATETLAIRHGAGLADLSALYRYYAGGPDAVEFLDRLVTRSVRDMAPGSAFPAPVCDSLGRLVGLAHLARLTDTDFMISSATDLLTWFEDALGDYEVQVNDLSDHYAALGLYGPRAREALEAIGVSLGVTLPAGAMAHARYGDAVLLIKHAGEWCAGYGLPESLEIWVNADSAVHMWAALAGALPGSLYPVGHETLERERILLARPRQGVDYEGVLTASAASRTVTPLELGWNRWIDERKDFFCGRAVLLADMERNETARVARLDLSDEIQKGAVLTKNGKAQGVVQSVATCPLGGETRGLALARVPVTEEGNWSVETQDPARAEPVPARLAAPREAPVPMNALPGAPEMDQIPAMPLKSRHRDIGTPLRRVDREEQDRGQKVMV